ncbi:MAG: hypothetical protein WBV61_14075 [Rhodanobacteraceae bacterium]
MQVAPALLTVTLADGDVPALLQSPVPHISNGAAVPAGALAADSATTVPTSTVKVQVFAVMLGGVVSGDVVRVQLVDWPGGENPPEDPLAARVTV